MNPKFMEEPVLGCMTLGERTGHEAGLVLLETLYRQTVGKTPPPIARTDRGKPYFTAGDWHFSISHTPRRVFCVLSRRNVAIDAEELDRPVTLALANRILSPMEKAQFNQSEDPRLALLRFWVLKEAAAKLSGEGLRGFPNHTEFSLDDPRVTIMEGCLVAVMQDA